MIERSDNPNKPKFIFIVGPTGAGKSDLAISVAESIGAEIICADSQTIRKDMDIGTAKPSLIERKKVPHHMLDLINPYDTYSTAKYVSKARRVIAKLSRSNKPTIIVGGSGLYIDALYYQFNFARVRPSQRSDVLYTLTIEELQNMIQESGYSLPTNSKNKRHLVNTIIRQGEVGGKAGPLPRSIIVGLDFDREVLKSRISTRVYNMFEAGFVDEVRAIISKYGPPPRSFDAIGYKIVWMYIRGQISLQEAKELFIKNDYSYAKRQRTWFKRNSDIVWFSDVEVAKSYILEKVC